MRLKRTLELNCVECFSKHLPLHYPHLLILWEICLPSHLFPTAHTLLPSLSLVPWTLSFLGDGCSTQLQGSAGRWHQESLLRNSTAELPPSWDNGAAVREVRGIFTISVASEIEFSQLLIKLIVPLLLYSQRNLVPMSEEAKIQRGFFLVSYPWEHLKCEVHISPPLAP